MEDHGMEQGQVLVVSSAGSFLAKSLVTKIASVGHDAVLTHGEIREIEQLREQIELIILFLSEDMEDMTEKFVYLKDFATDLDRKFILIGDTEERAFASKTIPENLVLVMFLTGHGDRESVLSVVGLSPADYLLKTIDKAGLRRKLEEFFSK